MIVGDIAGRRARLSPHRVAVVDTAHTPTLRLTYAELDDRAHALAAWLSSRAGVKRGDRVAILARDGVAHVDVLFACQKLGAIHVPLSWRLHTSELESLCRTVAPAVLVHDGEFADAAAAAAGPTGTRLLPDVVVDEVVASGARAPKPEAPRPSDPMILLHTGGTTATPRMVVISQRMVAVNAFAAALHDIRARDVYLCGFPLFHTGGLLVYTVPLLTLGGTVVLTPKLDAATMLDLVEGERPTVLGGVPTVFQRLLASPRWADADLSSLKFCNCGGAPLAPSVVRQFHADKGVLLKQGFGMTEFGPVAFSLPPEQAVERAGSIGPPTFFTRAQVVGQSTDGRRPRDVGPGVVGELWLRGPAMCSGTFAAGGDPVPVVDDKGWFHTGDLVIRDADGYYHVVDRAKDMFISGGENVYPVEIEAVLLGHAAVESCAVVAEPDAQWGEVGVAFVKLADDAHATQAELLDHVRGSLAKFKVPRRVELVESMPLSGPGKVLKRELRRRMTRLS